jgi:hypothetical protein
MQHHQAEDGQEDAADRIRIRVADRRYRALRGFLERAQRRRCRAGAGARTEQDPRIELEDVLPREDADDKRDHGDEDASHKTGRSRIA